MNINVKSQYVATEKEIGEALANATPEEFAEVWFRFAEKMSDIDKDGKKLEGFAIAMTPEHGALRKIIFKRMIKAIEYHEEYIKRKGTHK